MLQSEGNMKKFTHNVIIQPTQFCNIDCTYCYLPNRRSTKKIKDETVYRIFENLKTEELISDSTDIIWHASEPLTLPISFYENAFAIIKDVLGDIKPNHVFQTNAILINDSWCEFFKLHNVRIGISFDGPAHIHDRSRVDIKGRGTFDKVMKGVKCLQKHSIPFAVIAVVTNYALDYPDEIFDFFVSNGIYDFGFNFEESSLINSSTSINISSHYERCMSFYSRIIDLQLGCPVNVHIREVSQISNLLLFAGESYSTGMTTPYRILNFDIDGNFSTFCPEFLNVTQERFGKLDFGNVHSSSLSDMLNNETFREVYDEIKTGINACKNTCGYFSICGGGIPYNKIAETGRFSSTETQSCRLNIKMLTDIVSDRLTVMLSRS